MRKYYEMAYIFCCKHNQGLLFCCQLLLYDGLSQYLEGFKGYACDLELHQTKERGLARAKLLFFRASVVSCVTF